MSIKKELTIEDQLNIFKSGSHPLKIVAPCLLGNGIQKLNDFDSEEYLDYFRAMLNEKTCIKFIPASGAATRMFSDLIVLKNSIPKPNIKKISESDFESKDNLIYFFKNLKSLPFYKKLKNYLSKDYSNLSDEEDLTEILIALTADNKLGLVAKPKALIPFHNYMGLLRTPIYEHIQESKELILSNGMLSIHFTVSPEHQKAIQKRLNRISKNEVFYINSSLSHQSSKTDTVAVDMDNNPILDENGDFAKRPGGHGALIFNLNQLDYDIVFIKNIDNVIAVPHNRESNKYKQLVAGYFYKIQSKLFEFAFRYKNKPNDKALKREVIKYYKKYFEITIGNDENIFDYINRPLRVCCMVKNEGLPGGGPFFVEKNGKVSLQIVELSQIDHNNISNIKMINKSTHFNPVDLICGIKDFEGNKFNLLDFVDESSYFISEKTHEGKQIKALELPGLWNGGMYNWNTIFVEMPSEYFNPVKTIFDLLDGKRIIK